MDTTPDAQRIGTAQHFRWLHGIVQVLLVLNLLDVVFTLLWVSAGLAREANPVIGDLVRDRPLVFAAAKLAVVGLGSWLLWNRRRQPLAVVAIFVAFLAYYGVLLWHVGYLGLILGTLLFP